MLRATQYLRGGTSNQKYTEPMQLSDANYQLFRNNKEKTVTIDILGWLLYTYS